MSHLLEVRGLSVRFPVRSGILRRTTGWVRAVDDVSFTVDAGETLGVVGESGCGKSTTGLACVGLVAPTEGEVRLDGTDLTVLSARDLRRARRRMQVVFQDPTSSLNSRMTVGELVAEPLVVHRLATEVSARPRVEELLDLVGLPPDVVGRFPHEFSGGQRQRIAIARALAVQPDLLVCDEPIAALDVSVRAQVINLLRRLQAELGLGCVFISHDLAAVRHLAHRVAVMYLGRLMELTDRATLYAEPAHPYTKALLSAVPVPDPAVERTRARILLSGDVPSPLDPPPGCSFHTRCPVAQDVCREVVPEWRDIGSADRAHWVACHVAGRPSEAGVDDPAPAVAQPVAGGAQA